MNRAASFFALFCLLLIAVGACVAWWLGPALVSLAFDSQRASTPFYGIYLHQQERGLVESRDGYKIRLLQLLAHGPEPGPQADDPPEDNGPVALQPEATEPSQILWQTASVSVLSGSVADEWGGLVVARFATGREFVRLATAPKYREVRALTPGAERLVIGSSTPPLRSLDHPAALLLAVEGGMQAAVDDWVDEIVALGGEVVWDAPAVMLEANANQAEGIDNLVLIGFADAPALAAWAYSLQAQTTNALLRAKAEAMRLWLLQNLR